MLSTRMSYSGYCVAVPWIETIARNGTLGFSVLTVAEILRLIRDYELPRARRFFESMDRIPVRFEDAVRAAEMMGNRGPDLVDSHIAAAAIRRGDTDAFIGYTLRVNLTTRTISDVSKIRSSADSLRDDLQERHFR